MRMINSDDIKIKIKLLESETLLAQATVVILDVWEEHGWKILKSDRIHPVFQEQLWIQSPSYKVGGEWKELVFINDRRLFDNVQEKIYDAYRMVLSKKEGLKSIKQTEENIEITDVDYNKIEEGLLK